MRRCGLEVVMVDIADDAVARGIATVAGSLDRLVREGEDRGADKDAALKRIEGTTRYDELKVCDLSSRRLPRTRSSSQDSEEVDELARSDVVLATNTSSISITRLAAATSRPGKFVGMHFFNPVPMMSLVEVIRGHLTDDATVGRARLSRRRSARPPSS
jgi:3-hydroxybutyryl-CoA dehydrogenase